MLDSAAALRYRWAMLESSIEIQLLANAVKAMESSGKKTLNRGKGSILVSPIDGGDEWHLTLPVFSPAPQMCRLSKDRKLLEHRLLPVEVCGNKMPVDEIARALRAMLEHIGAKKKR
jgi:hypothetical protein